MRRILCAAVSVATLAILCGCSTPVLRRVTDTSGRPALGNVKLAIRNTGNEDVRVEIRYHTADRFMMSGAVPGRTQVLCVIPAGLYRGTVQQSSPDRVLSTTQHTLKLTEGDSYEWLVGGTSW